MSHPNIIVGDHSYFHPTAIVDFPSGDNKLVVGKFCSVAANVTFLLHGEHPMDLFSTFPFHARFPEWGIPKSNFAKGDIVIGNDVWIGRGATILSGVTIGDGAVIGAGAVVTKSVGDYEIHAGNPAKRIGLRPWPEHPEWSNYPIEEIKAMAQQYMNEEF